MTKRWTWLALLLLAMVALWGCSDDDDPTAPTQTDFEKMLEQGIAYINDSTDCPGVISAEAMVTAGITSFKIFDIRSADVFDAGHIEGAISAPAAAGDLSACIDVIEANADMTDDIVVACYTGQSAGHVKIGLELLGYENVKSLLWGMSSWNTSLCGSWNSNTANNCTVISQDQETLTTEYSYPSITGTVAERVETVLSAGFKGISYTDMVDAGIDDYFLLNYWGPADYLGEAGAAGPGHIPGAFQFTPYASLGMDEQLKYLPSDGTTIVVYCWTGQHSSQVAAFLNMLGYNAKSLKFGSNNLFYDSLGGHKWSEAAQSHDYPLVTN